MTMTVNDVNGCCGKISLQHNGIGYVNQPLHNIPSFSPWKTRNKLGHAFSKENDNAFQFLF